MVNRANATLLAVFGSTVWLFIVAWFYWEHDEYSNLTPLVPIALLGLTILVSVVFSWRLEMLNPVAVFSAYYSLFCVSGLYYLDTGFVTNEFFSYLSSDDLFNELNKTFWILVLGYSGFVVGFFATVRRDIPITMRFEGFYSEQLINVGAAILIAIGLLNFVFQAYSLAGGIPQFISTVGQRDLQLETYGGSTLGYRFLEAGIFLILFRDLRRGRLSAMVIALVLTGIFVRMTTGRITQTMVFAMVCMLLFYFRYYDRIKVRQIILIGVAFVGGGIVLYFARFISSLQGSYLAVSDVWMVVRALANPDVIAYFIIEKGNLPNLPVLMKVIEVWGNDVGFLYGQSFIYWVGNILPGDSQAIAIQLKQQFFWDAEGGNLPPTGVGEMYANFGTYGVGFGMLVLGYCSAKIYNYVRSRGTFWYYFAYAFFLFGFLFTYPKGESANLGITIIGVTPALLAALLLRFASRYLTGPVSLGVSGIGGTQDSRYL